ncbi:hypothetical protein D3C83_32300 [compost metagenome]
MAEVQRVGGNQRLAHALVDDVEPFRVAIGKRPQQHGVEDAEDGGIGADADRERQRGGERESRRAPQRAGGILEVLNERVEHGP